MTRFVNLMSHNQITAFTWQTQMSWWRSVFWSVNCSWLTHTLMIWRRSCRKNSFLNEIIDQIFHVCLRHFLCPDAACVHARTNQMNCCFIRKPQPLNLVMVVLQADVCNLISSKFMNKLCMYLLSGRFWACVRLSCRVLSTPTGSVTTCGRLSWTMWSSERWPTWWRLTRSRLSPVMGRANPCKTNWINGEFARLMCADVCQGRCTHLWCRYLRTFVSTSGHGSNMLLVCFLSADWTLTSVTWPGVYI